MGSSLSSTKKKKNEENEQWIQFDITFNITL